MTSLLKRIFAPDDMTNEQVATADIGHATLNGDTIAIAKRPTGWQRPRVPTLNASRRHKCGGLVNPEADTPLLCIRPTGHQGDHKAYGQLILEANKLTDPNAPKAIVVMGR